MRSIFHWKTFNQTLRRCNSVWCRNFIFAEKEIHWVYVLCMQREIVRSRELIYIVKRHSLPWRWKRQSKMFVNPITNSHSSSAYSDYGQGGLWPIASSIARHLARFSVTLIQLSLISHYNFSLPTSIHLKENVGKLSFIIKPS